VSTLQEIRIAIGHLSPRDKALLTADIAINAMSAGPKLSGWIAIDNDGMSMTLDFKFF
jgi:hypothetical protein